MTREERDKLHADNLALFNRSERDDFAQKTYDLLTRIVSALPVSDPAPVVETVPPDIMSMPISELDLSVRSANVMDRLGIRTIGELCNHSAEELAKARNFGVLSLADLVQRLSRRGLSLRPNGQRPALPNPAPTGLQAAVGELLICAENVLTRFCDANQTKYDENKWADFAEDPCPIQSLAISVRRVRAAMLSNLS